MLLAATALHAANGLGRRLNTLIRQRTDPFHDELIGLDDFFTRVAVFAIRRTCCGSSSGS